ncbi:uncharacterized protein LOC127259398 [Andrographis paniculata]|uniref:uncharacterized protein LOC127259398 n=1 Tax=Andrographis paniculata TaxID=175694 RepID=UPI0021E98630|nr:uncharacterized protein LOC127259398 [Andrographis paniculata]
MDRRKSYFNSIASPPARTSATSTGKKTPHSDKEEELTGKFSPMTNNIVSPDNNNGYDSQENTAGREESSGYEYSPFSLRSFHEYNWDELGISTDNNDFTVPLPSSEAESRNRIRGMIKWKNL